MAATRDERPAPTQKWKPKKKAWARVEARASEAATLPVASSLSVFSSSRWTGRPAGWGGSQRGEAGEEEVQWPVAGDRRCGSRTGLPEDRASGGRWAKRVTARAGAAGRRWASALRERKGLRRQGRGKSGRTGKRRSTSTIWRAERGEERGEGRAEADGADVERDGESEAAITVVVHGVGEAAADPPAHRSPNLLLSRFTLSASSPTRRPPCPPR
jgi:hypothetical protein|uniref:Uncharacterized protein n=2 Tax=Oryza sativa subsp. japonica TaxID=39947 RepID=A0A5S6R8J2_ORYSJ|nr:hypothetical protein [Oryza sativa Japonica Group]AAP54927.1 hypothetical protein LOC_Os10g40300 [Oryza sativa Japonica Group]